MRLVLVMLVSVTVLLGEEPSMLATKVNQNLPKLAELYKHLHANPELSYKEKESSKKIAEELSRWGFEVTEQVGGWGVVGLLENGSGPTLMIRADMDALPIREETGLAFSSQTEQPAMHACGHDVHMSVFVGTAEVLSQMKDTWSGTLMMVAQPAEEVGGGAKAMLKDGLFERFPTPDFALALHVSASVPAGRVGMVPGFAMASVDSIDITVKGRGGHGAYPHKAKDPIVIASQLVLALQTIISREIPPLEPAVLTVGSIHGGTKHNIIPNEVVLQCTLRTYSDEVRSQIIDAIKRIANQLARAAGLPDSHLPVVSVKNESIPSTYNDPELTAKVTRSIQMELGDSNVGTEPSAMVGEDFGMYGRTDAKVPICLFWLGAIQPDLFEASKGDGKPIPGLHTSRFQPDYQLTIETGVRAMGTAALDLLK